MIPESIETIQTVAIDETFAQRIDELQVSSLKIDFENETDTTKLELWVRQYGISKDIISGNFTAKEFAKLLQKVIAIYRKSGTKQSIIDLCVALGATNAEVTYNYQLKYNGKARYESLHKYDAGLQYKKFAITLKVSGVAISEQTAFKTKITNLWLIFEPIRLYLEDVVFV